MAKLTELNQYLIREKFLKIFGNKFHIMDENDQLTDSVNKKDLELKWTSDFMMTKVKTTNGWLSSKET